MSRTASVLWTLVVGTALLCACGGRPARTAGRAPAGPQVKTEESAPMSTEHDAESASDPEPLESPAETDLASSERAFSERDDAYWRRTLSPEAYRVLRAKGTERAFTGKYWDTKTPGVYKCAGCGLPLFVSDAKFDSGCGWPSFFEPLEGARLTETRDTTHGMVRTEITCSRCGGHLGHVFEDGPEPTGLRYCINSVSIDLEPKTAKDAEAPRKGDG